MFNIKKKKKNLFSKAATPFGISTNNVWRFQFLHILAITQCFLIIMPGGGFNWHFPNDLQCWEYLKCLLLIHISSVSTQLFHLLFNWIFTFFLRCKSTLNIWYRFYIKYKICKYFFQSVAWFSFLFFCLFVSSRATPAAYGGCQARGPIGAVAADLRHSHSNLGSKLRQQPTLQLTVTLDP